MIHKKLFISHQFHPSKAVCALFIVLFSLGISLANAAGWQRHDAPSPVWQIEPRVENGVQTGVFLGCQDNHVYAVSSSGDVEWSFDTKGLPSQMICADLFGDSKPEVIVATHDEAGTIRILSDQGQLLKSYAHGMPFVSIGMSSGSPVRIYGATYDGVVYFFDKNPLLSDKK